MPTPESQLAEYQRDISDLKSESSRHDEAIDNLKDGIARIEAKVAQVDEKSDKQFRWILGGVLAMVGNIVVQLMRH